MVSYYMGIIYGVRIDLEDNTWKKLSQAASDPMDHQIPRSKENLPAYPCFHNDEL